MQKMNYELIKGRNGKIDEPVSSSVTGKIGDFEILTDIFGHGAEKKLTVKLRVNSNYYLLNVTHLILKRVTLKEFNESVGAVVTYRTCKIKLIEGMRSDIKRFYEVFDGIILKGHSLASVFGAARDAYHGIGRVVQVVSHVMSTEKIRETQLLVADWISFLLQQCSGTYNNWTVPYLTGFLVRVATLYTRGKQLIGQTLDGVLMLAAATGLPKAVVEVLKNLSLLTSKKIGDHPNLVLDFVVTVSEYMCELVDGACWIPAGIKYQLLSVLRAGFVQKIIYRVNMLHDTWDKNKNYMLKEDFRKEVLSLKESIDSLENTPQLLASNNRFKIANEKICRMTKAVRSYEKCSRQEPVCIVLEGPPGVKKTIVALQTIQLLGRATYTHIVKATEDGKDFYDSYNNEDVFVMDDVGQQGVSQWRTVINMVSSLKLPLDCADVSLKDTKYFDSKIMMMTTNIFSRLHGLTKNDGISEITALWRRAHVIRFEREGRAVYTRYDIYTSQWTHEYPRGSNIDYPNYCEGSTEDIAEWLTGLTLLLERFYDGILKVVDMNSNELSARRRRIEEKISFVDAQDLSGLMPTLKVMWDTISEWTEELFATAMSLLTNVNEITGSLAVLGLFGFAYLFKNLKTETKQISDQEEIVRHWRDELKKRTRTPLITSNSQILMQGSSPSGTLVEAVKKNVKIVTIVARDGTTQTAQGVVSGSALLMVSHTVRDDKGKLIIYRDDDEFVNGSREYDLAPYTVVFRDKMKDLVILQLPTLNLTPYSNITHLIGNKNFTLGPAKRLWFVWAGGVETMEGACYDNLINAEYKTYERVVHLEGALAYNFGSPGFCGSLIVDEVCGIVGIHVAGKDTGYGVARIFPRSERQTLIDKLNTKVLEAELDNVDWAKPVMKQFSGMIKKTDKRSDGPKKTHLEPSLLAGAFEETKKPADLRSLGEHTVRLRALRNHKPAVKVPQAELDFMRKYIRNILPATFRPITDHEVIKGIKNEDEEKLAPLNKDSVSGFDFPEDKCNYFDFEEGVLRPVMSEELDNYRRECLEGFPKKITQHHTLKDELRVLEKVGKPRTFGVDSLATQYEMKRLLGEIMMHVRKHRYFSGCMIGINPYVEFQAMHRTLARAVGVWDGDIGEWDASVSPEIQDLLNEEILCRFVGSEEDALVLKRILDLSVRSWVVAGNREYMKTHGILSGMWITNLFNSIINRCYTAGWYYRVMKRAKIEPNINDFFHKVTVYVQGDDQLCAVHPGAHPDLNAQTMAEYYESLGMTYTDGRKNKIDKPYMPMEEVSFLKRKFAYHEELQTFVGVLSMETITNSLMWYKNDNDPVEILKNKLMAAQMELYLHEGCSAYRSEALEVKNKIVSVLREKRFTYVWYPQEYLKNLFLEDPQLAYAFYMRMVDKKY